MMLRVRNFFMGSLCKIVSDNKYGGVRTALKTSQKSAMSPYYIGVDVGTASVRAGLVTAEGAVVKNSTRPIEIWHDEGHFYEQSSDNIWEKLCEVVKVFVSSAFVYMETLAGNY